MTTWSRCTPARYERRRNEWVGIVEAWNVLCGIDEKEGSPWSSHLSSRPISQSHLFVRSSVIAAHGAQKVLGVWGGPGLAGWTQGVMRLGMRPPAFWPWVTACAEL